MVVKKKQKKKKQVQQIFQQNAFARYNRTDKATYKDILKNKLASKARHTSKEQDRFWCLKTRSFHQMGYFNFDRLPV